MKKALFAQARAKELAQAGQGDCASDGARSGARLGVTDGARDGARAGVRTSGPQRRSILRMDNIYCAWGKSTKLSP